MTNRELKVWTSTSRDKTKDNNMEGWEDFNNILEVRTSTTSSVNSSVAKEEVVSRLTLILVVADSTNRDTNKDNQKR